MALLRAYFDDSGTHRDLPVVVFGGLVGADTQWAGIRRQMARETSRAAAWQAKAQTISPFGLHGGG